MQLQPDQVYAAMGGITIRVTEASNGPATAMDFARRMAVRSI